MGNDSLTWEGEVLNQKVSMHVKTGVDQVMAYSHEAKANTKAMSLSLIWVLD